MARHAQPAIVVVDPKQEIQLTLLEAQYSRLALGLLDQSMPKMVQRDDLSPFSKRHNL